MSRLDLGRGGPAERKAGVPGIAQQGQSIRGPWTQSTNHLKHSFQHSSFSRGHSHATPSCPHTFQLSQTCEVQFVFNF